MTLDKGDRLGRISLFAKHAFKYYLVGASGVLVNLGILFALTEFVGLWYLLSSTIAIYVSITSNFLLNKTWTFRDTAIKQRDFLMYGKFIGVSLVGMGIQLGFNYMFVEKLSVYYLLAALISIMIASSVNFVLNRRLTFGIKL
ncbi:MAG TPA: GtrA family protein [Nitrosopumilaceae archaeon]|nr:GtrA family protein [Nitrosopumilaceae archaeon]